MNKKIMTVRGLIDSEALGFTSMHEHVLCDASFTRDRYAPFIPTDAPVEIRDITITNERNLPIEIDAVPVVEYTHFEALKQFTNADWVPQTMTSKADWEDDGNLI